MTTLTQSKFEEMVAMQEAMNSRVIKDWRSQNYAWKDAIWTEAAEAFGHLKFEWWKNQGSPINYEAVKLELIDIWHFLLSEIMSKEDLIKQDKGYDSLYSFVKDVIEFSESFNESLFKFDKLDFQKRALRFIVEGAAGLDGEKSPSGGVGHILGGFYLSLRAFDVSWDDLYKGYIGKNTLNRFRQDHGYKTDTASYKSTWYPEEDNDHLTIIVNSLDVDSPSFKEDIYAKLEDIWNYKNEPKKAVA